MVSRDAIDFVLGLKGITDRTGDALRPVQAWVVDEVAGRVRLRFGGETDEEAGTARYARNGGAPYAPGTEVMAQPVGREWFVVGPVQRGAGVATPSVEGTGALPGAPVPDLLAVIAPSIRWQGAVRTMTAKQRALALRMVRQFPGLLQVASGGRVGCRVRLVVQEETWDLDAAITAGRAEVTAFGTTGSWITDQGAQSLWATYGGLTYDTRMLFLGTSQMDSTVNELTRRDFPYSFINPEDTWYDAERAANRVTDTMVHAYMRQLEEILRDHGVDPTPVDGYAAAGFGVDPVKGLMPWFQQWWRTADLSGLVDDGRLPDVDARTSLVPFTRIDLDDAWGSLQSANSAIPLGDTEVLPHTTFGVVVPYAINLGSQWGGDQTIPAEQRTRMKDAAAAMAARVRRLAGVAVDLTVVNPTRFAITINVVNGATSFASVSATAAEFARVGVGADKNDARIVLSPYYGPGPTASTNGTMLSSKQGIAYDNNQFTLGAFGSWGATLTHEWLHSVETRLRDAGYTVGYGLDCPAVHDGSTDAGQHRAKYPEGTVDRDEWRFLDDMMSNRVPKPGGGFYGISPEMWAKIFPPVPVAVAVTSTTTTGTTASTIRPVLEFVTDNVPAAGARDTTAANVYIPGQTLSFTLPEGTWEVVVVAAVSASTTEVGPNLLARWYFDDILMKTLASGTSAGLQNRTRSFTYRFFSVAAGAHTVRTEFASDSAATPHVPFTYRDGRIEARAYLLNGSTVTVTAAGQQTLATYVDGALDKTNPAAIDIRAGTGVTVTKGLGGGGTQYIVAATGGTATGTTITAYPSTGAAFMLDGIGVGTGLTLERQNNGAIYAVRFGATAGTATEGNDPRLSDARPPTAHTHDDRFSTRPRSRRSWRARPVPPIPTH